MSHPTRLNAQAITRASTLRLAHHRSRLTAVLILAAAACSPATVGAQPITSWELSGEFSTSSNASGQVWTYGRQFMQGNSVAVYSMLSPGTLWSTLQGWKSPNNNWAPAVYQNTAGTVLPYANAAVPARGVFMFPGFSCERAAVRFTPPTSGLYRVSGQFWGAVSGAPGQLQSSVHIRHIAGSVPTTLFTAQITEPSQMQRSFTSKQVALQTNEHLDFEVGCGSSGTFPFGLLTGVHAVVERIGDYCSVNGSRTSC